MPRWPEGYKAGQWKICLKCGGKKDFSAVFCRKCTVYGKPLLGVKGKDHPSWKRGYRIDRDGYIKTYAPDHPWPRKGGYVFEHVRIIELIIGRRIATDENVHHEDGDKQNNDISNLRLLKKSEHSCLHAKQMAKQRHRDSFGRFAGKEVPQCR